MSKAFDKELLEIAQWYTYHKSDAMSVEKRLEFLVQSLDFLIWVLARAAEDLQALEGRTRRGAIITDPYLFRAVPNDLKRGAAG